MQNAYDGVNSQLLTMDWQPELKCVHTLGLYGIACQFMIKQEQKPKCLSHAAEREAFNTSATQDMASQSVHPPHKPHVDSAL